MPFKFNFNSEGKECVDEDQGEPPSSTNNHDAVLVPIEDKHYKTASDSSVCETTVGELKIKHVSSQDAESKLRQSGGQISCAIENASDLVPNVYEGGLKVWECSMDLARFMESSGLKLEGRRILELGCGAGLPGLFAYARGATCCFQDFNKEVIDLSTIPNVILNTSTQDCRRDTSFIAGDWLAVPSILQTLPKFDIILMSETIYNQNSQKKLLQVMKTALDTKGSVYLASKTCYFGVGGSLRQFEELLVSDGTFNYRTVWKTEAGVQREILLLTFRDNQDR